MNKLAKVRNFPMSSIALLQMFETGRAGHFLVLEGFPADAKILRHSWDRDRNAYFVTVWSDTFDAVKEGNIIPEQSITFRNLSDGFRALWREWVAKAEDFKVTRGDSAVEAAYRQCAKELRTLIAMEEKEKAERIARTAEAVPADRLVPENSSGNDGSDGRLESGS